MGLLGLGPRRCPPPALRRRHRAPAGRGPLAVPPGDGAGVWCGPPPEADRRACRPWHPAGPGAQEPAPEPDLGLAGPSAAAPRGGPAAAARAPAVWAPTVPAWLPTAWNMECSSWVA
eukprot:10979500-Alexandrium_andersonii.AAC.1